MDKSELLQQIGLLLKQYHDSGGRQIDYVAFKRSVFVSDGMPDGSPAWNVSVTMGDGKE